MKIINRDTKSTTYTHLKLPTTNTQKNQTLRKMGNYKYFIYASQITNNGHKKYHTVINLTTALQFYQTQFRNEKCTTGPLEIVEYNYSILMLIPQQRTQKLTIHYSICKNPNLRTLIYKRELLNWVF